MLTDIKVQKTMKREFLKMDYQTVFMKVWKRLTVLSIYIKGNSSLQKCFIPNGFIIALMTRFKQKKDDMGIWTNVCSDVQIVEEIGIKRHFWLQGFSTFFKNYVKPQFCVYMSSWKRWNQELL